MTKILKLAAAAVVGLASAVHAAPVTWGVNGHQYELVMNTGISWTTALADTAALGNGWHLATVTSAPEQDFIVASFLTPNPTTNPAAHFWLGGSDAVTEGVWTWITGEAFSYTNWNAGEPNDGAGRENYVALDARGGLTWRWNDVPNDIEDVYGGTYAMGYVIERTVPEPAGWALALAALAAAGLARRRRG